VTSDREVRLAAQVLPTGVDRIDGELSSTLAGNGSGSVNVDVAVLDTGVDSDHPDLDVAGGVSGTQGAGDFEDGNGHGTHVAGTIAVAAGNATRDFRTSVPAAYDEVLTVTAVSDFDGQPGALSSPTCRSDEDDTFANFSNFATLKDDQDHTIAGPGVCILSTWKNGSYNTISGTSMATPHLAGTAGLCIANGCGASPTQVIQKLRRDAEGYNERGDTGYGFVSDPLRPVSGKYFGFLVRAGLY
jgi:subtilisin